MVINTVADGLECPPERHLKSYGMDGNRSFGFLNGTGGMETPDRWGWYIKATVTHVIVAVGVVANCLTFILMKSPRLRFKSYSHYLSALAVFDSLVLAVQEVSTVDDILQQNFDHPGIFYGFSDVACKIFTYADTVCNLMSSWLIVAMAIERLCVVYMPFRRNIWCQQKGAVIIILTLVVVTASTQVFRLAMVHNNGGGCITEHSHQAVFFILHIYIYQFTLLFVLPVTIVLFCNIGVLVRIFSVEKATQNEDSSSTRLTGTSRRRSKTTRLMVAISFTYILTTLPIVVLTMTIHTIGKTMPRADAARHLMRSIPWFHFLQTVTNINYASNFFIYILSGKKFRIEFRRIFKHSRHNSSVFGGSSRTRDEIIMM